MATSDDINEIANLCDNTSSATLAKLIAMGPCPTNAKAADIWHKQDTQYKESIAKLGNVSNDIAATIVTEELDGLWPTLDDLDVAVTSASATIDAIKDFNAIVNKVATIIDFGVAVVAMASVPTPLGAASIVSSYQKMMA